MDNNYDLTPSFFNNQETFEKYLGQTSYYKILQEAMKKLCLFIKPNKIIELGSATGSTAIALAKTCAESTVVGIDMRQDVIEIAKEIAQKEEISNVKFEVSNFCDYTGYANADFIAMLYSFHHIEDPSEEKEKFLEKLKNETKKGTYLCIGETFLPKSYDDMTKEEITELWRVRSNEGKYSTFWASIDGVSKEKIANSMDIAEFCMHHESIAGNEVVERKTEFLVSSQELIKMAKKTGWEVIFSYPCNTVGEEIVLLRN